MHRALVMLATAAALLAGCASQAPAPAVATTPASTAPVRQVPCDDGGDGGVMIHGVCL